MKKIKNIKIVFGILLFIIILLLFFLLYLRYNRNIQSTTKKTINPEFPVFPVLPTPSTNNQKYYISLTNPRVPAEILTKDNGMKIVQRNKIFQDTEIPENFSWREKLGNKILPARDQKQCGDCTVFASTSTLSDRYAARYNVMAPPLSVLWAATNINYYLNGDKTPYSCDNTRGGGEYDYLKFFKDIGCKLDSCWPIDRYDSNPIFSFPEPLLLKPSDCCIDGCKNPIASDIYRINNISYLSDITNSGLDNIQITKNIQLEIMNNGPVFGGFEVFQDFLSHNPFKSTYIKRDDKDEIYIRNSDDTYGWHSVEVTGWGTKIVNSKKIRYWEIKSSWGTDFSDNGYFKIAFSIDTPSPDNWCYLDIPLITNDNGKVYIDGGLFTFSVLECDGCQNILPLKTMFQKNPVPQNILTDLGNQSEYLILLPGPGTEIDIDLHSYIKWGRVYDNDDGSITDAYIHGCPSKLSCDYVKSYYPSTYCSGRGYIFGTSGSFDLTINVYYKIREIKTGKISNLYHIYYDARCQNSSDPFYQNAEGEGRTYGDNFILFPGDRVFQPPHIGICRAPVVIAGI